MVVTNQMPQHLSTLRGSPKTVHWKILGESQFCEIELKIRSYHPIYHALITILSTFCSRFQKYHHALGTFYFNVIKEASQTSSACEDSLELSSEC